MTHALVYPMFAMVILTMIVGFITFRVRVRAAKSGEVDPRYFKTYSVGNPSEAVLKTGRHFNNMFEAPTLFYAGCLAGMIVGVAGIIPLAFAWLFVAARIAHAYIHMGKNKIWPRVGAFMFGLTCIVGLWICVLVRTIQIDS